MGRTYRHSRTGRTLYGDIVHALYCLDRNRSQVVIFVRDSRRNSAKPSKRRTAVLGLIITKQNV